MTALRIDKIGPEWWALLARCPADIWERIAVATFKTRPSPTFDATA